jgi:O-antigen ligase
MIFIFKEKLILFAPIVLLLAFTGKDFVQIRVFINIFSILIITSLFIKRFGINFKIYPKLPNQIIYFALFLIFTLFISASFSIDAISGYTVILRTVIFLIISYFFFSLIKDYETLLNYIYALFFIVVIVGLSIFYDLSKTGFTIFTITGDLLRQGGLYENPNYVGLILVMTIPITISMFFNNYTSNIPIKFFLTLNLIFSAILLMISNSRASMLGVFLSTLVTISLLKRKLLYHLLLGLSLIVVISLFIVEIQDIFLLFLRLERINTREYFWNAGLDIINDFPFWGIGPEMFENYFFTYMPSALYSSFFGLYTTWTLGTPHPHNFFILFAAENGVLGIISAVLFFVVFFRIAIRTIRLHTNTQYYSLSVALFASGVGMFARSFFEVTGFLTYGFIARDLPFWLIFGIIIYLYQLKT